VKKEVASKERGFKYRMRSQKRSFTGKTKRSLPGKRKRSLNSKRDSESERQRESARERARELTSNYRKRKRPLSLLPERARGLFLNRENVLY